MDAAKRVIVTVIRENKASYPGAEVRVGFIRYGDGARNYALLQPTSDETTILKALLNTRVTPFGDEYVGWFIHTATQKMQWSQGAGVVKKLYMVGNETTQQGPLDSREMAHDAARSGIQVNVIYCPEIGEIRHEVARNQDMARPTRAGVPTPSPDPVNVIMHERFQETQRTWLYTAYFGGGEVLKVVSSLGQFERWTAEDVRRGVEGTLPQLAEGYTVPNPQPAGFGLTPQLTRRFGRTGNSFRP